MRRAGRRPGSDSDLDWPGREGTEHGLRFDSESQADHSRPEHEGCAGDGDAGSAVGHGGSSQEVDESRLILSQIRAAFANLARAGCSFCDAIWNSFVTPCGAIRAYNTC